MEDNEEKKEQLEVSKDGKIEYEDLAKQIQIEYDMGSKHQEPKKEVWRNRLKLYNNQKRDPDAVGDTTMFTIMQTVVASLYIDRLNVEFQGREEGDDDQADNLNAMAKADYADMEKDELDYDWIWTTCFYGRGIISLEEYIRDPEKKIYLPVPHLVDPLTFVRDPDATSINGDRTHLGAARFFGYDMKMGNEDIEEHPHMLKNRSNDDITYGSGVKSLDKKAREARADAQGNQLQQNLDSEESLGANAQSEITLWYTHYEMDGEVKKVKVWLSNEREKVIGIQVLDDQEEWPLIDRTLYPTANDWDGTSIPDLTEDKQRQRAVAQNLGLKAMKADLYPMYIYDSNKITNRNDLKFGFNKFIPMDGKGENLNTAIMPMTKANPNMQLLDFIYTSLDASAQKATATPEIQQGALSNNQRTLGELNLISSSVDTRYSLSAKIFGMSEKRFWRRWYRIYKENLMDDIDEKILRIVGAFGAKWRPLTKKDVITNIDPDIVIESQILSRAQQLEERESLSNFFTLAFQDPSTNRRYGFKKLAKLHGMDKDEIDRLFPPTIDERIAEDENDLLNEDKFAPVQAEDDHNVHLEMHSKAKDTTAAKAHIETHKKALSIKKVNPELFPADPMESAFNQPGTPQIQGVGGGGQSKNSRVTPSQSSGMPM